MRIDVLTLFPEMFPAVLNASIVGRALGSGVAEVNLIGAIERELAGIWAEVLSVDRVGIRDDFLALGGHSLAASRIVARAIATFRADLSVKALFDSPTVEAMAVVIAGSLERQDQRHRSDA